MQSQMEVALKKAGVHILPIRQRIWQFVKDNPGCTSNTIISKVSGATQRHISNLKSCELISATYDRRRDKQGYMRNISLFTASSVYDGSCRPKQHKTKAEVAKVEAEVAKVEAKVEAPISYKLDLDSLTIAEARQLYAVLKKMFG